MPHRRRIFVSRVLRGLLPGHALRQVPQQLRFSARCSSQQPGAALASAWTPTISTSWGFAPARIVSIASSRARNSLLAAFASLAIGF